MSLNVPKLALVTATIDLDRAWPFIGTWLHKAEYPIQVYIIEQGQGAREWERKVVAGTHGTGDHHVQRYGRRGIAGVVSPFAQGLAKALHDGAEIVACLHDDVELAPEAPAGWDSRVRKLFGYKREVGLVGYGGALGLAEENIYQPGVPYNPMQLVRKDFGSNMTHAEAHGQRWTREREIAVLDGFSQIGRAEFWRGQAGPGHEQAATIPPITLAPNLFYEMHNQGIVHHAYDAALGAYAKALGWKVWFLPEPVHHHGGLTAVADPRYHAWADHRTEHEEKAGSGDQWFWEQSHRIVYDTFKNTGALPIRVQGP